LFQPPSKPVRNHAHHAVVVVLDLPCSRSRCPAPGHRAARPPAASCSECIPAQDAWAGLRHSPGANQLLDPVQRMPSDTLNCSSTSTDPRSVVSSLVSRPLASWFKVTRNRDRTTTPARQADPPSSNLETCRMSKAHQQAQTMTYFDQVSEQRHFCEANWARFLPHWNCSRLRLGAVADAVTQPVTVSYAQIPHFPQSTVEGHSAASWPACSAVCGSRHAGRCISTRATRRNRSPFPCGCWLGGIRFAC